MTETELREFLIWFKKRQEQEWQNYNPSLSLGITEEPDGRAAGWEWQQGTRWLPMSETEINSVGRRWNLEFPWDYRLFLSICGTPDRPALVERWIDDCRIEVIEAHKFMNWRGSDTEIAQRLSWPIMGLFGDGERPWWWKDEWGDWEGKVPRWEEAQHILTATRQAPQLIPFYSHRMLLPLPKQASAYLSVMGSDIIVYSRDLRGGLVADCCGDLSSVEESRFFRTVYESELDTRDVPLWGGIIG